MLWYQEPHAATTRFNEVITNDPRTKAAAAMVNSKEADVDGSYSAYYPTIRGSGSVGSIDNTDPL
ncbi:hypothetical protein TI03_01810, partial [Achromatium sp. WMS1]